MSKAREGGIARREGWEEGEVTEEGRSEREERTMKKIQKVIL